MAAMRHKSQRGDVLARQLIEVLTEGGALLRYPAYARSGILHTGDVLKLVQPLHRFDRHMDDGAGRNVVDDDRNADHVADRLAVLIKSFLHRLVPLRRGDY